MSNIWVYERGCFIFVVGNHTVSTGMKSTDDDGDDNVTIITIL